MSDSVKTLKADKPMAPGLVFNQNEKVNKLPIYFLYFKQISPRGE